MIPTEPIGSIPRPPELINALADGDISDGAIAPIFEEAVRDIIRRFEATGSPVIAEDRAKALDAGFKDHLSKPVDPSDLIAIIARLCERG